MAQALAQRVPLQSALTFLLPQMHRMYPTMQPPPAPRSVRPSHVPRAVLPLLRHRLPLSSRPR